MQLVHLANQSLHTCRSHPHLFQPQATIRQNHHGGFLPLDAFLMTALQRVRCALCRFSTEDISSFVGRDDCADFGGNWASEPRFGKIKHGREYVHQRPSPLMHIWESCCFIPRAWNVGSLISINFIPAAQPKPSHFRSPLRTMPGK